MGKISNEVSKELNSAIAEVTAKINNEPPIKTNVEENETEVEQLLNSGAMAQKKRHRRTKAEIEADKLAATTEEPNSLFEEILPETEKDNRPEWEKRSAVNHDEFCEWELQKAKLKNLPEPDFDFRAFYEKGCIRYFVRILPKLGEKQIHKLNLRTIYPRSIVGSEDKACCQCIGYAERNQIFDTYHEAKAFYDSVNITPKYSNDPKLASEDSDGTTEGCEEENGLDGEIRSQEDAEKTNED